ncbi:EAL domain-containing protein (putative c-di-GMP-specific phosphodiesterase class I) [Rhodopseudomonas rhenobacensis]|uniref:EAL domain-containing protein (Putative c-di-GMP-specific phosphodiesterase class I) n=1 Tax=Rhodopseudomonas rhenobacensis TaxID=87461 RepID=A0A7W7Z3K8_9BRAD|nr:EAL domain-containing protein [Rhodopseudomonas rhenobacensis]MBB5047037.1 EAL domain-containing protein (putative c-di-GMP-specific phosphodiesterase class I) [Rhodopseudomonas rhenobacensis]
MTQAPSEGDQSLPLLFAAVKREGDASDRIRRSLQAVRSHLGLQVAYVSKFEGDESVFRVVDAPGLEHVIKPGDRRSLDDIYCRHILEGRLPQLMPDTAAQPLAMAMPITAACHIGSHVSVPIELPNGETYGMFCCIGFQADPSLNERDLQTMKAFAEMASFEISSELDAQRELQVKQAQLSQVIAQDQMSIVYQPIWNTDVMQPVGFECLARFSPLPLRSPDKWFAEAGEVGMGVELELHAIRKALQALHSFPAPTELGVNASAATILEGNLEALFAGLPLDRVIVEITEHSTVGNYDAILKVLRPLRERGLRLAVDDAGAGYSSLRHILNMQPDFIKLDIGLTQNIDLDPARKALARALVGFARDTGSRIVAEGVERQSELDALRSIGVKKVQGYLLGRPMSLQDALGLCPARRRRKTVAA